MMMEDARTSIIARRALVQGLDPDGEGWLLTAANHLTVMDDEPIVDLLQDSLDDFLEVAFDPRRPLNCGSTVAEVAGDDPDELTGHAETQVAALLDSASNQGTGVVLAFLALKGLLGCAEWFGFWRWPPKVDAFVAALQDADHPWWHKIPSCQYPAAEVAALDVDELRSRLLAGPEAWDTEATASAIYPSRHPPDDAHPWTPATGPAPGRGESRSGTGRTPRRAPRPGTTARAPNSAPGRRDPAPRRTQSSSWGAGGKRTAEISRTAQEDRGPGDRGVSLAS